MRSDEPTTLRIYQTPSGKWAGRLMIGKEESSELAWLAQELSGLAWLARFASFSEIEDAIKESGLCPDHPR